MATSTIYGISSSTTKSFTTTLYYITSGGQWAYRGYNNISDAVTYYLDLPAGYTNIKSCKVYLNATVKDDWSRMESVSRSATLYMANSNTTTGDALTNTSSSTSVNCAGTAFTLSDAAVSSLNSTKPAQLGIRIAVSSKGGKDPGVTITQTSGQTTTKGAQATLTTTSFYVVIEYTKPTINYYTGSEWKACVPYYYDGSNWVECEVKYYDGSTWKDLTKK